LATEARFPGTPAIIGNYPKRRLRESGHRRLPPRTADIGALPFEHPNIRGIMKKSAAVVIAALALQGSFHASRTRADTMPIEGCTIIKASGTFVITKNIIYRARTCLGIQADNVTIDLAGFIITGNLQFSGPGIETAETAGRPPSVSLPICRVVRSYCGFDGDGTGS
jgi:hypothetical protein